MITPIWNDGEWFPDRDEYGDPVRIETKEPTAE